jgi:1,4-alpha-glucan branching enzyme
MNASTLTPPARLRSCTSAGRFPQGHYPLPDSSYTSVSPTRTTSSAPPEISNVKSPRGTVVFHFDALAADRVKLAADFTGWDKRPIDLRRREDGTWQVAVELPRGQYRYRFLVDDQWCDDPQSREYESNPFGGFDAIVRVM